jgi:hypothetical protein
MVFKDADHSYVSLHYLLIKKKHIIDLNSAFGYFTYKVAFAGSLKTYEKDVSIIVISAYFMRNPLLHFKYCACFNTITPDWTNVPAARYMVARFI